MDFYCFSFIVVAAAAEAFARDMFVLCGCCNAADFSQNLLPFQSTQQASLQSKGESLQIFHFNNFK